jgi:hypothetical protein
VCLTSYFLEGSHDLRHRKSSQSGSTCGVRSPSPRCHPDSKTPVVVVVVGGGGGCCAACELQPTFWLILWDSIVDCGLPAVSVEKRTFAGFGEGILGTEIGCAQNAGVALDGF